MTVDDRPVITAVSPNRGPSSGGSLVTIAGANFKAGAKASFGGVPATDVTVASSTQMRCSTPPHFPATVDVVVSNPDGQSGTLLRSYTYESDEAAVSLPNTGGGQNTIVQVSINAANVQGLASLDLTVAFNGALLKGRGARTGSLTSGWSLVVNTNTPGQLRLSMASPGGTVSGDGTLAVVDFEAIGSPGANASLQIANVTLNGGAIRVQKTDGSVSINLAYGVSGTIRYWNGNAPVPGTELRLEGDRIFTGKSASNGVFTVSGAIPGSYALVPRKSDDVRNITAQDASLVLQHAAGLITLAGNQATAADVDKSGSINSLDAFYILQKAVDLIALPFTGAGVVWDLVPAKRSYSNLNSDQTGQDFTGVLLGEVSGNWTDTATAQNAQPSKTRDVQLAAKSTPVVAALRKQVSSKTGETKLWILVNAAAPGVYSSDLTLASGSGNGRIMDVQAGPMAKTLALASNSQQAGTVRVALAGAVPIRGVGGLLIVGLANKSTNDFQLVQISINEGAASVEIETDGSVFDRDSDGDRQSDWDEIRGGTDPNDSQSVFAIKSTVLNPGGGRVITWSSVTGMTYRLQAKAPLSGSDWTNVGGEVQANGPTASQVDNGPSDSVGRFYRVLVVE